MKNFLLVGKRLGQRTVVTLNGFDLFTNHLHDGTPCPYNWGFVGHGSHYLAYAILLNYFNNEQLAEKYMYKFSNDIIAGLEHDQWTLTGEEIKKTLSTYDK